MASHEAAPERRAPRARLCSFAGTARQLGTDRACCRPASEAGCVRDAPQARRSLLCGRDPGPTTFSLLSSAAALQAAQRAGRRSRAFWLKLRRQWRRSSPGTRRRPSKARHGRYSQAGFAVVPKVASANQPGAFRAFSLCLRWPGAPAAGRSGQRCSMAAADQDSALRHCKACALKPQARDPAPLG